MNAHCISHHASHYQKGVVLTMALVVLVLLTILGVSAMKVSNLELLMSRNMQYKQYSFLSAEVALRAGRAQAASMTEPPLADGILADATPFPGVYVSDGALRDPYNSVTWTDNTQVVLVSVPTGLAAYFIEYMGDRNAAGGDGSVRVLYYRIVGRGSDGAASTHLESTYGVSKGS